MDIQYFKNATDIKQNSLFPIKLYIMDPSSTGKIGDNVTPASRVVTQVPQYNLHGGKLIGYSQHIEETSETVTSDNSGGDLTNISIINCWTPSETFTESIAQNFTTMYDATLGSALDQLNVFLAASVKQPIITDSMFRQVWTKPEPIKFDIDMLFFAEEETGTKSPKNIHNQIRHIQKCALPTVSVNLGGAITKIGEAATAEANKQVTNNSGNKSFNPLGTLLSQAGKFLVNKVAPLVGSNFLAPPGVINSQSTYLYKIRIGKFIQLVNLVVVGCDVDWNINDVWYDSAADRTYPIYAKGKLSVICEYIWSDQTIDGIIEYGKALEIKSGRTESQFKAARKGIDLNDWPTFIKNTLDVDVPSPNQG